MAGASKEVTEETSFTEKKIGGTNIMNVLCSFGKKIGAVAIVYLLGYFEFSIAWIIGPVILSVIRDEWKKEHELRRNIAKAAAMCNEKEVILARVDDLPSWVFFPDVERAEWLNRILRQVWPNVNHYAKDLIKDVIEPSIRSSLEAYKLSGFRFERLILGSIPLRIGGVKVYDRNVSRSEIIMDMDIFYAGDCDISFTIGGIKGGIKDFQIHGMLRVVMKPLITQMPLVGGLQVFFLNNPTLDFNLVGMADLLDMPGLSDILRRIIVECVANIMVLPNKLPIVLSDAVPATVLKTPEPEGVLRVHVVEAKQLMKMDIGMLGKGKSDPYAIITVGAQEFRTQTIDNTVNPKWDYWCESVVFDSRGQELQLHMYDADDLSKKDEDLGRATVDVSGVAKKGQVDLWVTLEGVKSGLVHLRMTWLTLSSCLDDLKAAIAETQLLRVTSMSSGLLIVFIDSAKNLPNARPNKKPDPFVTLTLGKQTEKTAIQYRTDDPVWEQGFTFLINNPDSDTLHLKVVDLKTQQEIGAFVFNLITLVEKPDLQMDSQPFRLNKSGPDSKIILSMQMKILKYVGPKEGAADDEEEGDGVEAPPAQLDVAQDGDNLSRTGSVRKSEVSTGPSEPGTPVKVISKQESKESVQSGSSSSFQQPIEDTIIPSKAPPGVDAAPGGDLRLRAPSTTSSAGEAGLGRIQLTLRYSVQRQRLIVVVHKIVNLPLGDPTNIPDPYVKLYLLPERAKDSKRKTETIKDNCNPVYDETFEYVLSQGELNSRQLEVSVVTRKGWFSSQSPVMGQVIINLIDLDLSKAATCWFDLQPENPKESSEVVFISANSVIGGHFLLVCKERTKYPNEKQLCTTAVHQAVYEVENASSPRFISALPPCDKGLAE